MFSSCISVLADSLNHLVTLSLSHFLTHALSLPLILPSTIVLQLVEVVAPPMSTPPSARITSLSTETSLLLEAWSKIALMLWGLASGTRWVDW